MEFHLKYRPRTLKAVLGQQEVIASLENLFKNTNTFPHTLLFSGSSGVGKTTLARIVAKNLGCPEKNVLEIDGATFTGIDDMKNVKEFLQYPSFGKSKLKIVILDEVQGLSKKAWDSMLKITEEPPSFVYFIFCTTELTKVPKAIKTRAHCFNLLPVSSDEILFLLTFISEKEELTTGQEVLQYISKNSDGSVREALVNLSKCSFAKTVEEVKTLMTGEAVSPAALDLCRAVANKNTSWEVLTGLVKQLESENMESVRLAIVGYTKSCLLRSRKDSDIVYFAKVLDCFFEPYYKNPGVASLLLSLVRLYYT